MRGPNSKTAWTLIWMRVKAGPGDIVRVSREGSAYP